MPMPSIFKTAVKRAPSQFTWHVSNVGGLAAQPTDIGGHHWREGGMGVLGPLCNLIQVQIDVLYIHSISSLHVW